MAGGKESPRQKMIGMMYLVLTALLALNVSKQIVAAFVTINDKLEASNGIIHHKSGDTYIGFNQKRAALTAMQAKTDKLDLWENRAHLLKEKTANMVGFLLSECNEMIKASEGEDWIDSTDIDGNIVQLKSLMKINGMDNYDIPTNIFVGGNPQMPNSRGMNLREKIHSFRDTITAIMGTYVDGKDNYRFVPPASESELAESLKTANPKDTNKLAQFYRALTIPEKVKSHDQGEKLMPWSAVMFDHAPIVAAAALFTSLKLDIKNAEALSAEYMLAKVDAPLFNFNKIEPMPFAAASYLNQGDSMNLTVLIAAIDTNNRAKIRFGVDDSISSNWNTTTGSIPLHTNEPGSHFIQGQIGVEQQGEITWKNWRYDYTVGKPMGVIGQPGMRVLYRGYDNVLEGTASGFPAENISLSCRGCSLRSQGGGKYIASVGSGIRDATVSITGRNKDGSTVNLGSYDFEVRPLPYAILKYGSIDNGDKPRISVVGAQNIFKCSFDPGVALKRVNFEIQSGSVSVEGIMRKGKVLPGGRPDSDAKRILRQARNKEVTVRVKYSDPTGTIKNAAMIFTPR